MNLPQKGFNLKIGEVELLQWMIKAKAWIPEAPNKLWFWGLIKSQVPKKRKDTIESFNLAVSRIPDEGISRTG